MTLKESNINTDGAPSAVAEAAPPSRAISAAADRVNPPEAQGTEAPEWERPMSAQEIRDDLAADWDWTDVDSLQAQGLYVRWALERLTADRLFQAKVAVMVGSHAAEGPHSPAELLPHLSPDDDRLAA